MTTSGLYSMVSYSSVGVTNGFSTFSGNLHQYINGDPLTVVGITGDGAHSSRFASSIPGINHFSTTTVGSSVTSDIF